jgi:hypothetical protein
MISLTTLVKNYTPVKETLLEYLIPSDIISLSQSICLPLSTYEKIKYMNPVNELFVNNHFFSNMSGILLIGDDIIRLTNYGVTDAHIHIYIFTDTLYIKQSRSMLDSIPHHIANMFRADTEVYSRGLCCNDLTYSCFNKYIASRIYITSHDLYETSLNTTRGLDIVSIEDISTEIRDVIEEWMDHDCPTDERYTCEVKCFISDKHSSRYTALRLTLQGEIQEIAGDNMAILRIIDVDCDLPLANRFKWSAVKFVAL